MNWKNLPSWLKGGLIGGIIFPITPILGGIIRGGLYLINNPFITFLPNIILGLYAEIFCEVPGSFACEEKGLALGLYSILLSIILWGFLIGALIGWIYGKIKSKKRKK